MDDYLMLARTDKTWTVSRVAPDDVLLAWPQLQPQLQRCLRYAAGDTMTERGLFEGIVSGKLELWIAHEGLDIRGGLILKAVERARGKALIVLAVVAGSGHGLKSYVEEILPLVREYGEMIGAYTIESVSRPGAARILMRLGCKPKGVLMELM